MRNSDNSHLLNYIVRVSAGNSSPNFPLSSDLSGPAAPDQKWYGGTRSWEAYRSLLILPHVFFILSASFSIIGLSHKIRPAQP